MFEVRSKSKIKVKSSVESLSLRWFRINCLKSCIFLQLDAVGIHLVKGFSGATEWPNRDGRFHSGAPATFQFFECFLVPVHLSLERAKTGRQRKPITGNTKENVRAL